MTAPAWPQCPPERLRSPIAWQYGQFGRSVQIEGDLAIAADSSDHSFCPASSCSSGAVHVFRRAGGVWEFETTVYHSRISASDGFGAAIAMDGATRFAASAPGEGVVAPDTGAVYIFEHDGDQWRQVAEILPVETRWASGFGATLALRGDTLVVGEPRNVVEGIGAVGAAFVYHFADGRWEFTQKLAPPDPRLGARFSNALALDGEWLMVGARLDDEGGHNAGAVYIYRRSPGGEFGFVRKLLAPGDPWNQVFGDDVGLDAERLAIGASNGPTAALGAVYVYELDRGDWVHAATLQHDDPVFQDALGASVALRGNTIVAGAPDQLIPEVTRGVAYVFQRRPDGSWRQAAKLLPKATVGIDFGRAVATDGASAIVGSPDEWVAGLVAPGAAHIFDLGCILCPADLDGDGALTFFDFLAFQNLFAAGDPAADFDDSGALDFFDFLAFQNAFAAGCA